MMPRVTVILPTYERATYLRKSLDSVLRQTLAPSQVIVVDDGSRDATPEILADYADRITILSKPNGGKPSAINAALPLVEGDYIWIFDDDDIACEDALERHIRVLERRPEIGFTYSGCFRFHAETATGIPIIDSSRPVRPFADDEFYIELLLSSYVPGPAVVVRSEVQRAAGAYRIDGFPCEDLDIATRWGLIAPAARLDEPRPSYFRRNHPGLRGAAHDRFKDEERIRRARAIERRIINELTLRLDRRQFLPHSLWHAQLDATLEARIELRRWVVHMQKGLWDEALINLARLAEVMIDTPTMRQDIDAVAPRALSDKRALAELRRRPEVMRQLRALLGMKSLGALHTVLVRQLYHNARAHTARDGTALRNTIVVALQMFGVSILSAVLNRLKR